MESPVLRRKTRRLVDHFISIFSSPEINGMVLPASDPCLNTAAPRNYLWPHILLLYGFSISSPSGFVIMVEWGCQGCSAGGSHEILKKMLPAFPTKAENHVPLGDETLRAVNNGRTLL